ncbi:hypothetical protein L593_13880 [Salinarchaeum sp. Harcht-Bsk1]|uniref:DUF5787 family protein n=1 Tax=Salinarchaeum sp. Harcht-Bsk1 TaxID=1333523 RepID=UPI0003423380|nr:DUF5787 family protein [Salinarchaeum sp. Harcht-Bsk1]AGN02715.1 hypothetical protein L593_13880 [Salinarchaeum sp. Harcht-Bsk1]
MREFGFELSLCARLEARGVPTLDGKDAIVARQLGAGVANPGGRVLDAVLVEPGPAFDDRAAITPERIPASVIDADLGPGRSRRVTDAFDVRPDRARSIAEHAAEIGVLELDRRSGHLHARQVARYPDRWFDRLVGIENKPDLGTPGALEEQLRIDVSLGVADRIVLATESYVTGAHRNRIPDDVGIWRFDPEADELVVIREAALLPAGEPGVEVLERQAGRAEIEVVDPDAKARARRRIAERAYGKGWRTFSFPECEQGTTRNRHGASLPWCAWKDRVVDPASECGPDCPGFEPADAPVVDGQTERMRASPWVAEPEGRKRRQTGLDRY